MSYFLLQFAFCGGYICFDQISPCDTARERYEGKRSRRRRVPLSIASLVFTALFYYFSHGCRENPAKFILAAILILNVVIMPFVLIVCLGAARFRIYRIYTLKRANFI